MNETFKKYLSLWSGKKIAQFYLYSSKKEKICCMLRNMGLTKEADLVASTFAQRVAAAYAYPQN